MYRHVQALLLRGEIVAWIAITERIDCIGGFGLDSHSDQSLYQNEDMV